MAPLRAIVLALASTAARGGDVTLAPLEGKSGAERAVLIVPGANRGFSAAQYAALGAAVQGASAAKLWVGIPEFEDGTSVDDASVFEAGAQRVLAVLAAAGMDAAAPLVAAGHSDGGAMVEAYAHAADGALAIEAVALLGSYIPRAHYAATPSNAAISTSSTAEYPVPTLTVGGALDGVARVTRVGAEAYYKQVAAAADPAAAARAFPVVVIDGVSHVQFADGVCSDGVTLERDLAPEADAAAATASIASVVADFFAVALDADAGAGARLDAAVGATASFVAPLLAAMELSGSAHLRDACNSDYPTNPTCNYTAWPNASFAGNSPAPAPDPLPPQDCMCGAAWVETRAQPIMAGFEQSDLPTATTVTHDAFHDVSDVAPFHLPHLFNACTLDDADCVLDGTTVSMPVFEDDDAADGASAPISEFEFKTKLKSREAMWDTIGMKVADTDVTDATSFNLCAEINQASLDWALDAAGADARARYDAIGEKLIIADDLEAPIGATGPTWIAKRMKYVRVDGADGRTNINVTSWSFTVDNHGNADLPYWIPAGYHYCKLLSPARAMEWIYVDGLRAYGAAASSADVTAACEACVATRDPVGLSYSSAWCHLDGNCYTVGDTSNPCTENQCASQASLSQCICSGCDELTCAF